MLIGEAKRAYQKKYMTGYMRKYRSLHKPTGSLQENDRSLHIKSDICAGSLQEQKQEIPPCPRGINPNVWAMKHK